MTETEIADYMKTEQTSPPVYELNNPTTFDDVADCVNTNVALWQKDRDYTIAFDITPEAQIAEACVFATNLSSTPYSGIKVYAAKQGNYIISVRGSNVNGNNTDTGIPRDYIGQIKMVITHAANSGRYNFAVMYNGVTTQYTADCDFGTPHNNSIYIGADDGWKSPVRPWKGVVNGFAVYYRAFSDNEITEYLNHQ